MMALTLPSIAGRRGFSLVELLVAIAVLSIMLVGLATAMGYVSRLWLSGVGSMDNFTKARVVLNLLDRDIQSMVLRRDLAAFVDSSGNGVDVNGNAICAFYTNIEGGSGSRTLSLVQYYLGNADGSAPPLIKPTLFRKSYGMNFATTSGITPTMGISSTLPTPTSGGAAVTPQNDTVFTGIIQCQTQFIDGNGNVLTPTSAGAGQTMANHGPFTYDFVYPGDPLNPRIVVISMLVLSNPAYTIATQSGTMSTLLGYFPNTLPATPANQTFSQYWNSLLNAGTLPASLPPAVRSGIQVFQRYIPLPLTTASS